MTNEDLIDYIQSQIKKNVPRDTIISRLAQAGWLLEDIDEGMNKVALLRAPNLSVTDRKIPDKYRELMGNEELNIDADKKAMPMAPKADPVFYVEPKLGRKESNVSPIFAKSFKEANPKPVISTEHIGDSKDSSFKMASGTTLEVYNEELLPTLKPKVHVQEEPVQPKSSIIDNLPKSAIISSYSQDFSDANKVTEGPLAPKKKRSLAWLLVILALLVVGGGVVFASRSGYLKSLTFSFIKKDPKIVLASSSEAFSMLKSYKIETNAMLSMPLVANITSGLASGEATPSTDRDFISFNTKGTINQNTIPVTHFDYATTVSSSLLKDPIITSFKYDNSTLFVDVPNLSEIFAADAPTVATVSIGRGEFNAITALLPSIIADKIKMVDVNKVLSNGVPPYINADVALAFKEFVNSSDIVEKSPEDIHGIPTYHYQINADRASTKKFLSTIINSFVTNLSESDKLYLDEGVGATTIDSLEVWIGKDDNNIHQYKLSLVTPLSKIIGLDDKGIAGNVVRLDWGTTYYDFDVSNNIEMPQNTLPISDFVKSIYDKKIKDVVSMLKDNASDLHNAEGSFGKKSNSSGNCNNPTSGSLYSPTGHTKGSNSAVGNIASTMNSILSQTNGAGYCYSTSTAWAAAFPLPSNPNSLFCIDSTGEFNILSTPITGVICK